MKRGWITWDHAELPPSAFAARLDRVRRILSERELPALIVYSDIWKSNHARYLANFMPYWNRSLLVVPQEAPPILLCGLSPRVYPWIRSISVLEEIRPSGDLARALLQLCLEKHWAKIGVLDFRQLPDGIHAPVRAGHLEVVALPSSEILPSTPDDWELSMRRHAARMAREIVTEELAGGVELLDHQLVGRLERRFRRAGAEDVVILVTNGQTTPVPANGSTLAENFSVAIAMEYRGHWVRLSRPHAPARAALSMHAQFEDVIKDLKAPRAAPAYLRNLSGPYPYESQDRSQVGRGSVFALDIEFSPDGDRLFYGDTCWYGERGAELL